VNRRRRLIPLGAWNSPKSKVGRDRTKRGRQSKVQSPRSKVVTPDPPDRASAFAWCGRARATADECARTLIFLISKCARRSLVVGCWDFIGCWLLAVGCYPRLRLLELHSHSPPCTSARDPSVCDRGRIFTVDSAAQRRDGCEQDYGTTDGHRFTQIPGSEDAGTALRAWGCFAAPRSAVCARPRACGLPSGRIRPRSRRPESHLLFWWR
jgi:hypothetical protein